MGKAESEMPVLWGRGLRMVLVNMMMDRPSVTVAELVNMVAELGYRLDARPSKVISDALRWEVQAGRVQRLRRGVYQYLGAPRSTARRIRILAGRAQTWVVATTRNQLPPPTPPDPRRLPLDPPSQPSRPPWNGLGWLWVI